jgi:hypothetical protein
VRALLCACALAVGLAEQAQETAATSPALQPIPQWVREACGANRLATEGLCPSAMPLSARGDLVLTLVTATRGFRVDELQLKSGGEYFGDERRNRPPRFFGFLLASGDLAHGFPGLFPAAGAPVGDVRDGLANARVRAPLFLGRRRWAGHNGDLSLAPSESNSPATSAYLRYLFFRWRDAAGLHTAALHTWEPFTETVKTLHALIDGLGRGTPSRLAPSARTGRTDGVAMTRTPSWLHDACRALRTRVICPRIIPMASASFLEVSYQPQVGPATDLLSVQWSAPYENEPARNRPPRFLHLELESGAVPVERRYSHGPTEPRNGLMRRRDYEAADPLPLGRPRWGGRNGVLVLGDCFGNHLCFRWRERGIGYQIDLHGWEPFTKTVAALRAVVGSLPPVSG